MDSEKKEIITRVLPGFMELLPEEQIAFNRMKDVIAETYAQFGFTPLDTPAIERSKTLLAKAGGETEKQIYSVENRGGGAGTSDEAGERAELSLRFDLTVPLARYVADHFHDLSFPFRRSHIAKVYRGERPQKGRFREFYQCDIDVIGRGSLSIAYDAEIPSIIFQVFKRLDFGKFTIRINNRKLLNGLFRALSIQADPAEILRILDKSEKILAKELQTLLAEQGLGPKIIETLLRFIQIRGSVAEILAQLRGLGVDDALFLSGVEELDTVTALMLDMGVDPAYFTIDLSIARGLDYYTGTVYETKLDAYPRLGSVCSGGRFDDLASYYTDEKLPGVGISIGLTRLFYQLRAIGLIPCAQKTIADAVVVPLQAVNTPAALRAAQALRAGGCKADVLLEACSVKKKFQYVSKKDARFTVVIGTEEEETGLLTLQYKQDGQVIKEKVPFDTLAARAQALHSESESHTIA
ncbi:MAG: histidine--tRNA ligase [Oscillospiraceae bacterium]|jgi:histidyl-tRNA synthetase|nr:histidine--tRNA ligase [Oscillospiraceae bacterium]